MSPRVRTLAAWLPLMLALAGCGLARPAPLDLPPGQRAVIGRVDLSALETMEGYLEVVRDGGGFESAISIGRLTREFAIGLPPGHYRLTRLRAGKDRQSTGDQVVWHLPPLGFDVDAGPGVYIGTLRFRATFGRQLAVSVADELDDTLRVLRGWYPDLPATPVRSLAGPR